MGSQVPKESPEASSVSSAAAPETLARLVLRCRELSAFLEGALPRLPTRDETPFLYGQLDEVLQRLQSNLRQVAQSGPAGGDRNASFLRRLAGKKAREQPTKKAEPRYDLQGNAWTIPVTELVGFLSHSGKSGLLWVTSPAETFVLEFSRGNLVHATSNAPPVAFRLGEILLSEELLSASELAEVIDYAKAADDLLGSYLVRTGRLQHGDLQRALAIQVQQLFHRLMDAENALYRFQDGAQLLRSQSLEVNITQLLLESARRKDEERLGADGCRARPEPTGLEILAPEEPHAAAPAVGSSSPRAAEESAGEDEERGMGTQAAATTSAEKAAETPAQASAEDEAEAEAEAKPEAALPRSKPEAATSEKAISSSSTPVSD